jgi:hypothetical protein
MQRRGHTSFHERATRHALHESGARVRRVRHEHGLSVRGHEESSLVSVSSRPPHRVACVLVVYVRVSWHVPCAQCADTGWFRWSYPSRLPGSSARVRRRTRTWAVPRKLVSAAAQQALPAQAAQRVVARAARAAGVRAVRRAAQQPAVALALRAVARRAVAPAAREPWVERPTAAALAERAAPVERAVRPAERAAAPRAIRSATCALARAALARSAALKRARSTSAPAASAVASELFRGECAAVESVLLR